MMQVRSQLDDVDPALVELARDVALSHQLAEFAGEQGDVEGAQHFRRLATEAEQRLTRLAVRLAD